MFVRYIGLLALLSTPLAITACSDIGLAPGSATVRFVNAVPGAGLLGFVSNTGFPVNGIAFERYSGCTSLSSGTVTFSFGGNGSGIAPFTMNPVTLFGGGKYTIMATGNPASPSALVLADTFSAPAAGTAMLRVVNDIPSAGSVDIFIDAPGAPLVTPRQTNIAVGEAAYIPVQAGTNLQVWLTTPVAGGGTPAIIATTTTPLSFTSGQEETLFFIAPSGGSTPLYFVVPHCF